MKLLLILGTVLVLVSSCAAPPPKETLPERTLPPAGSRVKPDEIVAFYNGEPLSWQVIAEKTLELNLKESVDQYVRWRLVEDRKSAMGIVHSPEELRRRAGVYLEAARRQLGAAAYRQQLEREGMTEEAKLARVEKSPFLSQLLTLDKIVRFAEVLEDRTEIDRAYFSDEADAKRFREACTAKGFDDAAKEQLAERKPNRGLLPKESFSKAHPPQNPVLDAWIVEELQRMAPGDVTGLEASRSNYHYVIRLRGFRKGRDIVYSEVREEVLE